MHRIAAGDDRAAVAARHHQPAPGDRVGLIRTKLRKDGAQVAGLAADLDLASIEAGGVQRGVHQPGQAGNGLAGLAATLQHLVGVSRSRRRISRCSAESTRASGVRNWCEIMVPKWR